jgi:hypothetical protein
MQKFALMNDVVKRLFVRFNLNKGNPIPLFCRYLYQSYSSDIPSMSSLIIRLPDQSDTCHRFRTLTVRTPDGKESKKKDWRKGIK